jgi:hypothetical protein
LGAKFSFPFYGQFSLGAEITYKTVAMNADARVENQKFDDGGSIQYFSGTAEMNMSFTMLECPLYAKYRFGHSSHTLLVGGYYAYVMSRKFETIAKKGYIGSLPDVVDSPVDEDYIFSFSESMRNWDVGIIVGYELQVISRVHLGLRVMMGCADIFKPTDRYFEYNMYPMRGSVTLSYSLFNWRLKRGTVVPEIAPWYYN